MFYVEHVLILKIYLNEIDFYNIINRPGCYEINYTASSSVNVYRVAKMFTTHFHTQVLQLFLPLESEKTGENLVDSTRNLPA